MNRYRKSFQIFEELREGLHRAQKFYSEMRETVDNIGKNVEGFVNNRRAEGAQLLSQIEQNKASSANSHANAERERLQQLMERMSMDPSTASSAGSDLRPPPVPPQSAYQRSPAASPLPTVANADPRFTIPPQKNARPVVETINYQPPPVANGYPYSSQPTPIDPNQHAQFQSHPQQPHHISQGAAAPLSEGYHPMAYPASTPISPPGPPHAPQFFPPLSTTPQPGQSYYPPQLPTPQSQYPHHARFPSNPNSGSQPNSSASGYVPPPPPGPPPGSMTVYPQSAGPMPSGPGGYAQIGRMTPGQQKPQQQPLPMAPPQGYVQSPSQGQPPGPGQGDPWAGLNTWR